MLAHVSAATRRRTSGTRRPPSRPCACTSRPSRSFASSGSQSDPQITLMTFQPAPRNAASSSWMILPLPRTGPSSRCRLQLMTKIRLSSFSRDASVIAPSASGSSVSPSPRNAQTLRSVRELQSAIFQVAIEARLVNRHDRAESHRDRRELPEIGHQPGMRDRRTARRRASARGGSFPAASSEGGPPEMRARKRRAPRVPESKPMSPSVLSACAAEEMIESDFIERRGRSIRRDVAADACPTTCWRAPPWPARSSEPGS